MSQPPRQKAEIIGLSLDHIAVLSTVVFNIGPSIFDIVAASVYVAAQLDIWVAIIIFVTLSSYIPITVTLSPLNHAYPYQLKHQTS